MLQGIESVESIEMNELCSLQVKVRVEVRDRLRIQSAIENISMGELADRLLDEGLLSIEKGKGRK